MKWRKIERFCHPSRTAADDPYRLTHYLVAVAYRAIAQGPFTQGFGKVCHGRLYIACPRCEQHRRSAGFAARPLGSKGFTIALESSTVPVIVSIG